MLRTITVLAFCASLPKVAHAADVNMIDADVVFSVQRRSALLAAPSNDEFNRPATIAISSENGDLLAICRETQATAGIVKCPQRINWPSGGGALRFELDSNEAGNPTVWPAVLRLPGDAVFVSLRGSVQHLDRLSRVADIRASLTRSADPRVRISSRWLASRPPHMRGRLSSLDFVLQNDAPFPIYVDAQGGTASGQLYRFVEGVRVAASDTECFWTRRPTKVVVEPGASLYVTELVPNGSIPPGEYLYQVLFSHNPRTDSQAEVETWTVAEYRFEVE